MKGPNRDTKSEFSTFRNFKCVSDFRARTLQRRFDSRTNASLSCVFQTPLIVTLPYVSLCNLGGAPIEIQAHGRALYDLLDRYRPIKFLFAYNLMAK